jgi:hypothetical protein
VPGAENRLIADVEQNRVPVIVVDQESEVWDKYHFGDYAPRVLEYIKQAYRPLDSRDKDRARIFVRQAP